jgi:hypothetical protein
LRVFQDNLPGDIAAERLLGEIVAGHGISPGPAAAADADIFALAAVVLIGFEIAELQEKFGIFPDCLERDLLDIARRSGEIAARLDFPVDIDETDELTGQAAF